MQKIFDVPIPTNSEKYYFCSPKNGYVLNVKNCKKTTKSQTNRMQNKYLQQELSPTQFRYNKD